MNIPIISTTDGYSAAIWICLHPGAEITFAAPREESDYFFDIFSNKQ
jgi:hypothetical protein